MTLFDLMYQEMKTQSFHILLLYILLMRFQIYNHYGQMKIEVSTGEAVDKYTILSIKKVKLTII